MAQKIPPPPPFSGPEWQTFNRWLLELTSILNNEGGINPNQVKGLPALFTQVASNTTDILSLETTQGDQANDIVNLQGQIAALQDAIVVANTQLTALGARAQVYNGTGAPAAGLGSVNDWYGDIAGAVGTRIYIKTGAATWTAFPF